jgi:hypothetical protein
LVVAAAATLLWQPSQVTHARMSFPDVHYLHSYDISARCPQTSLCLPIINHKCDAFAGGSGIAALKKVIAPSLPLRGLVSLFGCTRTRGARFSSTCHSALQAEVAPKAAGGERSFVDDIKKVCSLARHLTGRVLVLHSLSEPLHADGRIALEEKG